MAHSVNKDYALFIVADGLGGHQAGEKASQYFCQGMLHHAKMFSKRIEQNSKDVLSEWLDEAINHMKVLFKGDQVANKAHTTCAVLFLNEAMTMTAYCGDSRVYRMNPQGILWRTKDHSIPQDLVDAGLITEAELSNHPDQNQLTRSISVNKAHVIDIQESEPIKDDETFMLCSDGFWENVKPSELLQLADLKSNKEMLAKQVRLAIYRARGRSDNVSVLTARCRQAR